MGVLRIADCGFALRASGAGVAGMRATKTVSSTDFADFTDLET
jgi:hypothetical protein